MEMATRGSEDAVDHDFLESCLRFILRSGKNDTLAGRKTRCFDDYTVGDGINVLQGILVRRERLLLVTV